MDKNLINYGQHYMIDETIFDKLIEESDLKPNDIVLEIGAGDGRLTKKLCSKCQKVISFEIDNRNKVELEKLNLKNVIFYFCNFLDFSFPLSFNKIIASLPYQITEPFIEKISRLDFESATLIVGKKFAEGCDKKKLTKNAIYTNCYFNVSYIQDVSPDKFDPPPKVYSSIIKLVKKSKNELLEEKSFFIFKQLFEQRDKKLKNALKESLIRYYQEKGEVLTQKESKAKISQIFTDEELDLYIENFTNQQYECLWKKVEKLN